MGDSWQDFESRFMGLAREEQERTDVITKGETLRRINKVLRASCNYREHPEGWERGKPEQGLICLLKAPPHGVWNYDSNGISENFFERVRLCVAEAGRALPDYPKGADSEDFWLHRLYFDLLKNKSDLLFCGSNEGGMILSVCVASATFCARLERQGFQRSETTEDRGKFCDQVIAEMKRIRNLALGSGRSIAEIETEQPELAVWKVRTSLCSEDQDTFNHPNQWGPVVGYTKMLLSKTHDVSQHTISSWVKAYRRNRKAGNA